MSNHSDTFCWPKAHYATCGPEQILESQKTLYLQLVMKFLRKFTINFSYGEDRRVWTSTRTQKRARHHDVTEFQRRFPVWRSQGGADHAIALGIMSKNDQGKTHGCKSAKHRRYRHN
ncbi:MAG: hypothetical protein OXM00_03335 [Paracoccaceae bacterium]|nr:hypothetical protein [Paracoccaceae bacterium]